MKSFAYKGAGRILSTRACVFDSGAGTLCSMGAGGEDVVELCGLVRGRVALVVY